MTTPLFYRPRSGWAGDVTPYFHDGVFHLFYLKELRDEPYDSSRELAHAPDSRLSFHHLTTTDFVTFADHGVAIPAGGDEAPDRSTGTGSVVHDGERFHFFYSGMNPSRPTPQVQLVATSEDLFTWRKEPGFVLEAPAGYEAEDFRDPFVLRSPEGPGYWMLLAGRVPDAPWHRRGRTLLLTSPDLRGWGDGQTLYAPQTYHMHECPDLFRIGDWWYLVFSEFSRGMQTRYRMARHPLGPFLVPKVDTFDTRACYAAKTVSDGSRRILVGWAPTRDEAGEWLWGGHLVAMELEQRPDGTLVPRPLTGLAEAAGSPVAVNPVPVRGRWEVDGAGARSGHADGYRVLGLGEVGRRWALRLRLSSTGAGGIVVADGPQLATGLELRFEPDGLVLDRFPRRGEDGPLERRPWTGAHQKHRLTVVRDDDLLHVVSAGAVALTSRVEGNGRSVLGAFAEHGDIEVEAVELWA